MRIDRIQQNQLSQPTTPLVVITSKQLIEPEYHDYLENYHKQEQMIHKHSI